MEECETAAVGREAPPQIVPALDLMHRLIGDQLLQHRRRGLPVDPPPLEKTAGGTNGWAFGSARLAARSSSSSWVPSASRLAFWRSGRAAFGITMTPS